MKKVAIFGGTGFIGRELARALAERGDEAVIVPREPARGVAAGSFRRLTWRGTWRTIRRFWKDARQSSSRRSKRRSGTCCESGSGPEAGFTAPAVP
jgi:NAD(P)-dependent dehydrogenase (short-subunit alcohol dehydrogenase family)